MECVWCKNPFIWKLFVITVKFIQDISDSTFFGKKVKFINIRRFNFFGWIVFLSYLFVIDDGALEVKGLYLYISLIEWDIIKRSDLTQAFSNSLKRELVQIKSRPSIYCSKIRGWFHRTFYERNLQKTYKAIRFE